MGIGVVSAKLETPVFRFPLYGGGKSEGDNFPGFQEGAFARIAIPVNEEISITGELLRIDVIHDGGYSAYILEKEDRG